MTQINAETHYSGSIPQMYDSILGPCYFEPYAIETASRVAMYHPQHILEIAAGTGRVTNHLQKNLPKSAITATDISADMLAVAKQKMSGAATITWQVADAMQLPFADEMFDAVVCQFGAMFFPDKPKGFAEAFRVLKKGGRIFFTTWDKLEFNLISAASRVLITEFFDGHPPQELKVAFSMADKDEINALLAGAGFQNIKVESVNKVCMAESAEKLAYSSVDGSIILKYIQQINAAAVPLLREKLAKRIAEKFGDHPVKSTMQAVLSTAEKK